MRQTTRSIRLHRAAGIVSAHAALWLAVPHLVVTVTVVLECALATAVILTALYARERYSKRAFRMLPWTTPKSS
jgi:hypothetical protein